MRQIYLVAVWILSVWALPKSHLSPASSIFPSVTPPPCLRSLVPDGNAAKQLLAFALDQPHSRQDGVQVSAEKGGESEKKGRWGVVLEERSIHRRSDSGVDDDDDGFLDDRDVDGEERGGSETRAAKSAPTETMDSATAESTTEAETKTTDDLTTATDKTTEPTSNTASTMSTTSETTTTSEPRSTTTSATTTSQTSTAFSTTSRVTATASRNPKSDGKLDKSAIAGASVFSGIALIALLFLGILYFRKARVAWKRRKQDGLSRATSRYSAVPLVEEDAATKAALAQTHGSQGSDRQSLMFSRSRSSSVTFAIDESQGPNSITRTYYGNGAIYVPLEQVDTSYHASREAAAASSSERNVSPPVSVVVSPPPDGPDSPVSGVSSPPSAAAPAGAYIRDSARVSDHSHTNITGSAHGFSSGGPALLPSISRSVSPILDLSRRYGQH
ncbi:hypothetical protein VTN02DRAFT_5371 [Thermoascus thermophilus]